jgi:sterol desaturase/sphingolipid hydroxylase (fatty acid hydroxylase superfamily)
MSQNASIVFRVLGAVLLIILIAVGGFMAFQAGQAQGYTLGAASVSSPDGQSSNAAVSGSMGMVHHFTPFLGFYGILPALIGLFIVFGIFRMFFCGHRYMHHAPWMYGPNPRYPWPVEHPYEEPGKSSNPSAGGQEAEKK